MVRNIDKIITELNKTYGEDAVMLGNKSFFKQMPRLPSGVFSLDMELGGGWPRGRIVHIYGPKSSGKSFISYKAIANAQRLCHWCTTPIGNGNCQCGANDPMAAAWIDIESTDDMNWRVRVGVNNDLLLVCKPEHAQQSIDIVDHLIRSGEVSIIVFDSIAALVPIDNIEKSAEEGQQPGTIARLMALACRKWTSALNTKMKHPKTGKKWPNLCTIFCLNQLRDQMGGGGGKYKPAAEPPGGHAIRFFSSVEVRLQSAKSDFDMKETADGQSHAESQETRFMVEKNKTYPPRRSGSFVLDFDKCTIDNPRQIFGYAKRFEVLNASGAHYEYNGKKYHGEEKALNAMIENGDMKKLEAEVRKMLRDLIEFNTKAPTAAAPKKKSASSKLKV